MQKEDFYRLEIRFDVMQMVLHSLLEQLKKTASHEALESIEDGWREGFQAHAIQLDALHGADAEHLEWLADEQADYEGRLTGSPAISAGKPARSRRRKSR